MGPIPVRPVFLQENIRTHGETQENIRTHGETHGETREYGGTTLWKVSKRAAVCKSRREASRETNPAGTFISDFQTPEL